MADSEAVWASLTLGGLGVQYLALMAREFGMLYLNGMVFFRVERRWPAHPQQPFFKSDFRTELGYPIVNTLVSTPILTLLMAALVMPLVGVLAPYHLMESVAATLPFLLQMFLAMLLVDVAVYVEHRFLAHRWFWPFHTLHHMTPEVSWLTAARVHPVNAITIGMCTTVSHYIFGFDGLAVTVAGVTGGLLASWEHSNLSFAFPKPFCYLLVSPRFHRWHHAREAEAVDKNFCLIFPFIDLICGTYYCPDRLPHAYGIHGPESAEAAIPDRFGAQLAYPFERKLAELRERLGRSERELPATSSTGADREFRGSFGSTASAQDTPIDS